MIRTEQQFTIKELALTFESASVNPFKTKILQRIENILWRTGYFAGLFVRSFSGTAIFPLMARAPDRLCRRRTREAQCTGTVGEGAKRQYIAGLLKI